MRPLVAVSGQRIAPGGVVGWRQGGVAVPEAYLRALRRAGGLEGVLYPERIDPEEAERRLERFDALLLIGGGDLDPATYGQDASPECYGMDDETDCFELELSRAAVRRGMPLLAICRGMQVLNVALGGTLEQHIGGRAGLLDHGTPGLASSTHSVRLDAGSRVADAAGDVVVETASSHHQAVGRLGNGLTVTGRSDDGVVEAVETNEGWIVGVQWHPERTAARDAAQQGLFEAFVARSRG